MIPPLWGLKFNSNQVPLLVYDIVTRIYGCVLHVDIKDGKIWVQHDGTEDAIAEQLVTLGVPKQDIVLAYHAPHVRQYTEFALG